MDYGEIKSTKDEEKEVEGENKIHQEEKCIMA